ncbi:porin [Brucella suis]|uniref:porin n=1 Tax=Brucella suis TaxID=29461 RepID=UPI003F4F446A
MRVHGYVRYDVKGGDDVYTGSDRKGWDKGARFALMFNTNSETELGTLGTCARFALMFNTNSETELGTLGTYTQLRFNYTSNNSRHDGQYGDFSDDRDVADGGVSTGTDLQFAYITLGGFKVGIDESEFHTFTGYLGTSVMSSTMMSSLLAPTAPARSRTPSLAETASRLTPSPAETASRL